MPTHAIVNFPTYISPFPRLSHIQPLATSFPTLQASCSDKLSPLHVGRVAGWPGTCRWVLKGEVRQLAQEATRADREDVTSRKVEAGWRQYQITQPVDIFVCFVLFFKRKSHHVAQSGHALPSCLFLPRAKIHLHHCSGLQPPGSSARQD